MTAIECLLEDIKKEKIQARKEGLREGREEGREQGIKEEKRKISIKIAKELINIGVDIDIVCKVTKLTKKEIEQECY